MSHSMEDDIYIHRYSTCISQPPRCTAYYSTVVHGMQLPRQELYDSLQATGIAGASRREELAFVVQEGSFLRFLFPRGVHVLVRSDATTMLLSS